MLESLRGVDLPPKVRQIVQGLSIMDPETLHFVLSLLMTRMTRNGATIPFEALEHHDGGGILTCGINLEGKELHLFFIEGDKEEIVAKMKAMYGPRSIEIVDPYHVPGSDDPN